MEKRLQRLVQEVEAELESIEQRPTATHIKYTFNNRLKRALGRCRCVRHSPGYYYIIELAPIVMHASDQFVKQILHHEILHTFPDCMNHGTEWQRRAEKVNRELGYQISRLTDPTELVTTMGEEAYLGRYKYKLVCQGCGRTYYRMRKSSVVTDPSRYYCTNCHGRFEVFEM